MQNALYVEISAVGIILLTVVLLSQRQVTTASAAQRRFSLLIYAAIVMLVVDALCWLVDGTHFLFARELNYALETIYYALHVLLPYFWALYVEGALSTDLRAARRRITVATVPLVVFIFALVFNLKYDFVFSIDAQNVYHRAFGVYLYAFLSYAYLIYGSIRSLIKARGAAWVDDRRRYYTMAFFAVLPSLGGFIQLFYYGVSLNWILASVSILLVYLDSQNRQISTDPLTSLNNRRELTKFLLRETNEREQTKSGALKLIMMDVDGFKQINDTYGHFYGDGVLISVSEILKSSCKNTHAVLARYGGDEFCIVLPPGTEMNAEQFIARIETSVAAWNAAHADMKPIGLSIGFAVWNPEKDFSYESLLARADAHMYEVKNAKKHASGTK
ncbi:MAG: diguanylate cyclase [Alphaproteobacteria bacterium]|nr:diguanylate cyclase [Alphaproteobacteria bacterium]